MAKTLDEKLAEATDRAALLPGLIRDEQNNGAMSALAYQSALTRNDSIGADINLAANKAASLKITNYTAELKLLNEPITGVLAVLNAQKQIQLDAQARIVANALSAQQQSDIELARIRAASEAAIAEAKNPTVKSNTTTYVIIGAVVVVVIAIAVFAYFKMKK